MKKVTFLLISSWVIARVLVAAPTPSSIPSVHFSYAAEFDLACA